MGCLFRCRSPSASFNSSQEARLDDARGAQGASRGRAASSHHIYAVRFRASSSLERTRQCHAPQLAPCVGGIVADVSRCESAGARQRSRPGVVRTQTKVLLQYVSTNALDFPFRRNWRLKSTASSFNSIPVILAKSCKKCFSNKGKSS